MTSRHRFGWWLRACSVSLAAFLLIAAAAFGERPTLAQLKLAQELTRAQYDKILAATVGIHLEDSSGSGVIVSEDGYILTAAHVIVTPGTFSTLN
jgi:S1-C subfamily serine protease